MATLKQYEQGNVEVLSSDDIVPDHISQKIETVVVHQIEPARTPQQLSRET